MTDDKLNNIARAIGFVLAAAVLSLMAVGAAFGQENTGNSTGNPNGTDVRTLCVHASIVERWQAVRVAAPYQTKVTHFDGRYLEAVSQDRLTSHFLRLETNAETLLPKGFDKEWKGKRVLLIWCNVHSILYEASYPKK